MVGDRLPGPAVQARACFEYFKIKLEIAAVASDTKHG
jgi:hypothetical protein